MTTNQDPLDRFGAAVLAAMQAANAGVAGVAMFRLIEEIQHAGWAYADARFQRACEIYTAPPKSDGRTRACSAKLLVGPIIDHPNSAKGDAALGRDLGVEL